MLDIRAAAGGGGDRRRLRRRRQCLCGLSCVEKAQAPILVVARRSGATGAVAETTACEDAAKATSNAAMMTPCCHPQWDLWKDVMWESEDRRDCVRHIYK